MAHVHIEQRCEKRPFLAMPFYAKSDPFTKPGSGQTWGILKTRGVFRRPLPHGGAGGEAGGARADDGHVAAAGGVVV